MTFIHAWGWLPIIIPIVHSPVNGNWTNATEYNLQCSFCYLWPTLNWDYQHFTHQWNYYYFWQIYLHVFCFHLQLWSCFMTLHHNKCCLSFVALYGYSQKQTRLKYHVLFRHTVKSSVECFYRCLQTGGCLSVNICRDLAHNNINCELNSSAVEETEIDSNCMFYGLDVETC